MRLNDTDAWICIAPNCPPPTREQRQKASPWRCDTDCWAI